MVAGNLISWVKNNVPQLYNKNLTYGTNEEVYALLLDLKNYYTSTEKKYSDNFTDIVRFNNMKNSAYTNFNTLLNNLNPDSADFESQVNDITNSGEIQACLEAYNSLSELMTKFFI